MTWRVVRKGIDHAQPLVDVVERRNSPHPLAEVLLSGRRCQHQLVNALGKEMIERVDVAHVFLPRMSRPEPSRVVMSGLRCSARRSTKRCTADHRDGLMIVL